MSSWYYLSLRSRDLFSITLFAFVKKMFYSGELAVENLNLWTT